MNSETEPIARRRKKILVDRSLQGGLIAAFVVLEVLILCGAVVYLYWRLGAVLDEFTFRTHFQQVPDIGQLLLREGLAVIAVCTLINAVALIIADRLWNRHIDRSLAPFRRIASRISALDLRTEPEDERSTDHEVARLAARWLAHEREHLLRVDEGLQRLEKTPRGDVQAFQAALGDLRNIFDAAAGTAHAVTDCGATGVSETVATVSGAR